MDLIEEVNIVFIGNCLSGKTSIISAICNGIYDKNNTTNITIYKNRNVISNYTNYKHYFIKNIDIKISNINLIDTVGYLYNNFIDNPTTQFLMDSRDNIDLIIIVIDVNTVLDSSLINNIIEKRFDNILYVINKCDDIDKLPHNIIMQLEHIYRDHFKNTENFNYICLSANNIICNKSIKNYNNIIFENSCNIIKTHLKLYNAYNKETTTLIDLHYYIFIDTIHKLLPYQNIINNKIIKYTYKLETINDLINISLRYNISNVIFNKYLFSLIKRVKENYKSASQKEKRELLLKNININFKNMDFIIENTTLQHCISNIINVYDLLQDSNNINYFKYLCISDIIFTKVICDLLYINMQKLKEISIIVDFLIQIDRKQLLDKIKYIDEIIFNIFKNILTNKIVRNNGTIENKYNMESINLKIIMFIDLHFIHFSSYLPISAKLKYYQINNHNSGNMNEFLITNTQNMSDACNIGDDFKSCNILNLCRFIFGIEIKKQDDMINKSNFIKKIINEKIPVFPCVGKHPLVKNWNYTDNYISRKNINLLETKNIGLVCGELSGIFVIDIDIKDNGLTFWKKLLNIFVHGNDIDTLKVRSANGGIHYYFKLDDKLRNIPTKNKVFSMPMEKIGIDIRNNNGYVIMPFSKLEDNKTYSFINYNDDVDIMNQINTIPEWLYNALYEWYKSTESLCEITDLSNDLFNDFKDINEIDLYLSGDFKINTDFDDYHNIFSTRNNLNYIACSTYENKDNNIDEIIKIVVKARNVSAAAKKATSIFYRIFNKKNSEILYKDNIETKYKEITRFKIKIIHQLSNKKNAYYIINTERNMLKKPVSFIKNGVEIKIYYENNIINNNITNYRQNYGGYSKYKNHYKYKFNDNTIKIEDLLKIEKQIFKYYIMSNIYIHPILINVNIHNISNVKLLLKKEWDNLDVENKEKYKTLFEEDKKLSILYNYLFNAKDNDDDDNNSDNNDNENNEDKKLIDYKNIKKNLRDKKTSKAKKSAKPIRPKTALTAYNYFTQEHRTKTHSENPNMSFKELSRKMRERWDSLSNEERIIYINLHRQDIDRYEREKRALKEAQRNTIIFS